MATNTQAIHPRNIPGARFIAAGYSAHVYVLPNNTIAKVPKDFREGEDDPSDTHRLDLLIEERNIYALLGQHPHLLAYLGPYIPATLPAPPALHAAFLLEYASSGDLAHYINTTEPPAAHARARMLDGLVNGLAHAWARGVAHQDVKVDNVMICANGVAKLGDWGLAEDINATNADDMWRGDAVGFGTVVASVARWEVWRWDWRRHQNGWGENEGDEFPAGVEGRVWEGVVRGCLEGGFGSVGELVAEVGRVRARVEEVEEEEVPAWKTEVVEVEKGEWEGESGWNFP